MNQNLLAIKLWVNQILQKNWEGSKSTSNDKKMFFIFMNKDFELWNHMVIYLLNTLLELCENALSIVILEKKSDCQKNKLINGKNSM